MEIFELCLQVIRRERIQFGVFQSSSNLKKLSSISKVVNAATVNDINYDQVFNRIAYLFRCGTVNLLFASNSFSRFFEDYKDVGALLCRWKNTSNLTFCSMSTGPALDYVSLLLSCFKCVQFYPVFKNIEVISNYGAWRNTIEIMKQVLSEPYEKAFSGTILGNIHVTQADPMLDYTPDIHLVGFKADVVMMVKSVKDDRLNTRLMALLHSLKVGAILFCIETKPIVDKLLKQLSQVPGEMLYGPNPMNLKLDLDVPEDYKTEFGCGPILSARGMFFVWEKKSEDFLLEKSLVQKPTENLFSYENDSKNINLLKSQVSNSCLKIDNCNTLMENASFSSLPQTKSLPDLTGKCKTILFPELMHEPTNMPPNFVNNKQTTINMNPKNAPLGVFLDVKASNSVCSLKKKKRRLKKQKTAPSINHQECIESPFLSDSSLNSSLKKNDIAINNSTQTSFLQLQIGEKLDSKCVSDSVCSLESKNMCVQTVPDPQALLTNVERLSDLRHQINDLTLSLRKMLQTNTFKPCENEPKSSKNFVSDCCHASAHEHLHHFSNVMETSCICQREPIRCCCHLKQCSTRNYFENKHLCPASKCNSKFQHQSICSNIQSAPVQTPNLVIPLACLSEEALSMIMQPIFSNMKKD